MTIHLKPDQEQVIGQAIQAGLIRNAEEVLDMAVDALRGRLKPVPHGAQAKQPLAAKIRDIWHHMPDKVLAQLPKDGASQIDHYVYGLPKRGV